MRISPLSPLSRRHCAPSNGHAVTIKPKPTKTETRNKLDNNVVELDTHCLTSLRSSFRRFGASLAANILTLSFSRASLLLRIIFVIVNNTHISVSLLIFVFYPFKLLFIPRLRLSSRSLQPQPQRLLISTPKVSSSAAACVQVTYFSSA